MKLYNTRRRKYNYSQTLKFYRKSIKYLMKKSRSILNNTKKRYMEKKKYAKKFNNRKSSFYNILNQLKTNQKRKKYLERQI